MTQQRVLVADDDLSLSRMVRTMLAANGFDVLCAQDGYQAVELARRHQPDLMILDINMPAGDGFSVQTRLQKIADVSLVPILYMTGEESTRVRQASHDAAVVGVLKKPFDMQHLLKTVTDALSPLASEEAHES